MAAVSRSVQRPTTVIALMNVSVAAVDVLDMRTQGPVRYVLKLAEISLALADFRLTETADTTAFVALIH